MAQRGIGKVAFAVALLVFAAGPAAATEGETEFCGLKFNLGISAGFTGVDIRNAHFGLGVGGLGGDPSIEFMQDVSRVEAFVAPQADVYWPSDDLGTLHGGLRIVAAATRGDGDAWFLTHGEPSNLGVDNLYLEWKSGNTLPALGPDGLEVSVGRQNFQLADGMVLVDGNDEANQHGAVYWLDPQKGWENTGIVRVKLAPARLELFALTTNKVSGNDDIFGAHLELAHAKMGTVGASYFQVPESDIRGRDGLAVTAVHGRGRPLPFLPALELAAEFDVQKNDQPKKDARAWFAEASLGLYHLPWYPTIGYRYASFSGDDAGTAGKDEGWDYLHNGYTPRGFGYWYQGIVVGTYETRLSNLDTHFVHLTVAPPIQGSWAKVLYYDHRFNDSSTARLDGAGVSSNRFATEWDVILGYSPSKRVDYMAIYGTASPGRGGKERNFGSGEDETLIQFVVLLRY